MAYAPGEREREEAWLASRARRMQKRGELELAFSATDLAPYMALYDNWEAWIDWFAQMRMDPEPDPYLPDSPVIKNQNVW